jgi:molybdate-binding protein/transcriptional regulator with XRE-family HTH domain
MNVSPMAERRHSRGWSQAALAEKSGVSRAEISAIETGRLVPSVSVALRIASALGEAAEAVFGPHEAQAPAWAWKPSSNGDRRVWRASVNGRVRLYPVEPTAAGVLPHDGWFDGTELQPRDGSAMPERTLVIAGCDPLVSLLARQLARCDIRVLPILRASTAALELLRQGLVHAAGVHFTDASGASGNDRAVRAVAGAGHRLVHQVRWDTGIAVGRRRERTPAALLRANLRWVNREEGSAARQAFDTLLATRRRPAGYAHVVRDHRAVAATVSSGWAEAGVCVRPAAAEVQLGFIPLHRESYELCVADAQIEDPRITALMTTLQSKSYRQLIADVPGCDSSQTGDVRSVA